MKKLMIAAAIVCAAVISQAADFKWGLSGCYYDKNGSDMTYGTAFLYLGNVTAGEHAFNLGGATYLAMANYDAVAETYGSLEDAISSEALTSVEPQAYSIVLVNKEVDSLSDFEGNYAIVQGTSTKVSKPTTPVTYYAKFEYGDDVTTSLTMTKEDPEPTPEPTSALLMLLGVAGLALKRKQK